MTVAVDPNFKSSLPPRKRARTQEEKEQRRVERILRNRRAAHASREKKRKHVEYLESYVLLLESNLATLSDNYASVANLVSQDKIDGLNLPALQDLTSLKNQIHANMSLVTPASKPSKMGSVLFGDDDRDCDDMDHHGDFSVEDTPDIQVKKEETDGPAEAAPEDSKSSLLKVEESPLNLLTASPAGYFNYLLPVSINSPVNSPIDLQLKMSESVDLAESYSGSTTSGSMPSTPDMSMQHNEVSMMDSATSAFDTMAQNPAAILSPRLVMAWVASKNPWLFSACRTISSYRWLLQQIMERRILNNPWWPGGRFLLFNMRENFFRSVAV